MIEVEARMAELAARGHDRRTRLVSGPQGPHVLLDGKPVMLLCSSNYLGLADHPRVREAAAEAAMRWGAGAGASRLASGTMTVHRRLEERIAAFERRESALLFGSRYLANVGVIAALTRPGDVVFSDELSHPSIVDGCRTSGAEMFLYQHLDTEHLAWGIARAEGRGALIATDSVFPLDGDLAPLADIVALGRRNQIPVLVDEAHATGTLGPGGRGAVAQAGVHEEVDVITGSLGKALGSYGGFVACDRDIARYLLGAAQTFIFSTAPPPPSVAGALAALALLEDRPRLVEKLQSNAVKLHAGLVREGFELPRCQTQILPLILGDADLVERICHAALERGVFAQALGPPTVRASTSRVRLAVMASHRADELQAAARTLGGAARSLGLLSDARAMTRTAPAQASVTVEHPAVFDFEAQAA